MVNLEKIIALLAAAFQENTLVKLTLSQTTKSAPIALKNIYAKRVLIRQRPMLSFTLRHARRDEVQNFELAEALDFLRLQLTQNFRIANLLTTTQDSTWQRKNDQLQHRPASQVAPPAPTHNQQKNYLIAENAPFLQNLGISSNNGKVHAASQDKYRQINKYVEIMDTYLAKLNTEATLNVVDMGSGKGYLTFALFSHWQNKLPNGLNMLGIELREKLTAECNEIAEALQFSPNLSFRAQDINTFADHKIDVLIALHACDTATDLAIAKGIESNAQLIVVAPCCHRQIRNEMQPQSLLQPILKHGILEERQAEILTDGIRALLLEANGYRTQVFEFISYEHTAKNLLIVAQYTGIKNEEAKLQIQRIKSEFGISAHALESLLDFSIAK